MTAFPKITIFTTCYNAVLTIEKSIQSVLAQHYPNVEFIIVDGGSTDGTVQVIQRYADQLSHWVSREDQGPDYNVGVELATGDVIAFLNADDWYEPGILKAVGACFAAHPKVDVVSCFGAIEEQDPYDGLSRTILKIDTPKQLALNVFNVCFGTSAICQRFFSKKVFEQYGNFESYDVTGHANFTSDKSFLMQLALDKVSQCIVPIKGHVYRYHDYSFGFSNKCRYRERVCLEHVRMAHRYLSRAKKGSWNAWVLLFFLLKNQSHYALHAFQRGAFRQALRRTWRGLKHGHIIFLMILIYTPASIFYRRYFFYAGAKNKMSKWKTRLLRRIPNASE